jgi:hypothetical protein
MATHRNGAIDSEVGDELIIGTARRRVPNWLNLATLRTRAITIA